LKSEDFGGNVRVRIARFRFAPGTGHFYNGRSNPTPREFLCTTILECDSTCSFPHEECGYQVAFTIKGVIGTLSFVGDKSLRISL
jgi:hypothetical protein